MSEKPLHLQASESLPGLRAAPTTAAAERRNAADGDDRWRRDERAGDAWFEETGDHTAFLAQALALNAPALFLDYVSWAKVVLNRRNVPADEFAACLSSFAAMLKERMPAAPGAVAVEFVESALRAMPAMPEDLPTLLGNAAPMAPMVTQYLAALRRGDRQAASRLVLNAVAAGDSVKSVYLNVFQPAQYEIGRLWQTNRITVAQEHYCTAATQLIMSQLYPWIFSTPKIGRTLVATCVAGDLHEIGVRMVADFFEMEGWDTYYLGASAPADGVVAALVERQAQVLAVSVTMTYHLEAVRELIRRVREHPVARHVTILVGGHPFNQDRELWRAWGADGYAPDAQQAIALAGQMGKGHRT